MARLLHYSNMNNLAMYVKDGTIPPNGRPMFSIKKPLVYGSIREDSEPAAYLLSPLDNTLVPFELGASQMPPARIAMEWNKFIQWKEVVKRLKPDRERLRKDYQWWAQYGAYPAKHWWCSTKAIPIDEWIQIEVYASLEKGQPKRWIDLNPKDPTLEEAVKTIFRKVVDLNGAVVRHPDGTHEYRPPGSGWVS